MFSATVLLSFALSATAYQVTSPTLVNGWTTGGPNILKWNIEATDRKNFTAVLTNENRGIMPSDQVLAALVDGSLGSITANAPSGGWPMGVGFHVNLVQDADSLSTVLAKSPQFNITAPIASSTTPAATRALATSTPDTTSNPYDADTEPTGSISSARGIDVAVASVLAAVMAGALSTFLA